MSDWISVKEELPPKSTVVWLSSYKADDIEKNKEICVFVKDHWEYKSGIFAYTLTKDDAWKRIEVK